MRILTLALDTYEGKSDGVIVYVKRIIPELKKHFHIKIVAPKYSNSNIFNVETYLLPCLKKINISNYHPAIPRNILKEVIKDTDIVFVHDLAPIGFFSSILAKKYDKKLIIFCHHDERVMLEKALNLKGLFFVDTIVKSIYNKADKILVATGRFYRKLKRLNIQEEKIRILPFGIDVDRFKPDDKYKARKILGLPTDKRIVLYLGRISHEKNIKTLIKSTKFFDDRTILLIVGGGKYLNYYKKISRKISNKVIFTGEVSHDITHLYYKSADVFVSISFHESQSFTVMEAMASGLPVIVSYDNDSYTYLKENYNCLFVRNITDEKEVYKLIEKILEDNSLRKNLGKNARRTMLKYSWKNHVNSLIRYLNE